MKNFVFEKNATGKKIHSEKEIHTKLNLREGCQLKKIIAGSSHQRKSKTESTLKKIHYNLYFCIVVCTIHREY